MPPITQEDLQRLLKKQFPDMLDKYVKQFALLFLDFQKKCENTELSTKALDLRGMLDAIDLMHKGLSVKEALDLGITNKTFDIYEKQLIHDVINARISSKRLPSEIFQ